MSTEQLLIDWFAQAARDFPWRHPQRTPWGVLVSEVMAQQTPMARVEPAWRHWMAQWPRVQDAAAASRADILRAWGRLGYPRRALRLHEAARMIAATPDLVELFGMPAAQAHRHAPSDLVVRLRQLPGIGDYTAAAVATFACGQAAIVLDTNIRRVLARLYHGQDQPVGAPTRPERDCAAAAIPARREEAVAWTGAVMELGALICRARQPQCALCPVRDHCVWLAQGAPQREVPLSGQKWKGTDRQARGRIMALARAQSRVTRSAALAAAQVSTDPHQPLRALQSLIADGLLEDHADTVCLPH